MDRESCKKGLHFTPVHTLTLVTLATRMIAGWSNDAQTLLHVGGTSKETNPLQRLNIWDSPSAFTVEEAFCIGGRPSLKSFKKLPLSLTQA